MASFSGRRLAREDNIVMRENRRVVRGREIRELQKVLTLKDYDVLRGTPRSEHCEHLREIQEDLWKYLVNLTNKMSMSCKRHGVCESEEKSSEKCGPTLVMSRVRHQLDKWAC